MGWVADKINENTIINTKIVELWNALRDSIGGALLDFQLSVHDSGVTAKDCKSRGRFCFRVEKKGSFMEVFLDMPHHLVKSATLDSEEKTVCGYRLDATRQGLEFFSVQETQEPFPLSAEIVSKLALEEFLFTPFPAVLIVKAP
jgi:hypothetical protein